MEKREIIASVVKSNKSDNNVWAVSITGDEQPSAHCKTAYKAMRFMFLLKKQTGLYIADESLAKTPGTNTSRRWPDMTITS